MANSETAAVLGQYSQLMFLDSPQSPPLPQFVVDQRSGRSGQALNRYSQLRFNMKVPPKMNTIGTNFPSRPSPITIVKPPVKNSTGHWGRNMPVSGSFNQETPNDSFSSVESKLDLFMSDEMALASWLAKRDLERNREFAVTLLEQDGQEHVDDSTPQHDPDQNFHHDDSNGFDDGDESETEPTQADIKLQSETRRPLRYAQAKSVQRPQLLKSVQFQSNGSSQQHGLSASSHSVKHKFDRIVTSTEGQHYSQQQQQQQQQQQRQQPHKQQEHYLKEKNELCKLCQQLTGQLTAIEGILRRHCQEGCVEEEEENVRRVRVRGEEQMMRSNRLVYNLRQQLQELTGELDKYHSVSTNKAKKALVVQHLMSLYRGCCRVCQSLVRTATLLRPGMEFYQKQFTQLQDLCSTVKQVLCGVLELDLASQPTVDRMLDRVKSFEAFVGHIVGLHKETIGSNALRGQNKMAEADKEGGHVRQPQLRRPAQSTSTRGKRGAVAKNRGVILPPHLRRRMDRRADKRQEAEDTTNLDSHFTKETFSFWLKKQFQLMKSQQDQPKSTPLAVRKEIVPQSRGSYSAHREQGAPHGVGLHVSEHRQVRKTSSPTPSITIPPTPPGGQTDQRGNVPASLAATQPRREGVPLSAPAWDMMAQEISRQVREDNEVLKHFTSKHGEGSEDVCGDSFEKPSQPDLTHPKKREVVDKDGLCGSLEDNDLPGPPEIEQQAHILLNRPTMEAMMLRIQEIEDESNRLRHKWSKITYEDPFTTSHQGLDGCQVQQATNDTRKDLDHIHIEPVRVTGFSGYEFVCTKEGKDEEDGDTASISNFPVRTGVDDTPQEVVQRAEGDPVFIPDGMKQSIEGYRERYRQYQRRTCTQAVGDFDPATIIERISDAILDDILQELVQDTLEVCDTIASQVFSSEFARPDSSVDQSTTSLSTTITVDDTT